MKTIALVFGTLVCAACFQGGSGDGKQGADASVLQPSDGGSQDARLPPASDATGFVCNDDSELEPNNSIATATVTGIPGTSNSLRLVGLAICPGTDVDLYRFQIATNATDVAVRLDYDTANGALEFAIRNDAGSAIAVGVPATGNQDLIQASVPNLPIGTYFVAVRAAEGLENNYDLEIVTVP